jgi:neurotransmitter:Na+ symporter, NSS family
MSYKALVSSSGEALNNSLEMDIESTENPIVSSTSSDDGPHTPGTLGMQRTASSPELRGNAVNNLEIEMENIDYNRDDGPERQEGNNDNEEERGEWGSRLGFILASTGSAIGLGNIWKFPYITGVYGGGAFVIVYIFCVIIIGLPLMYAEFAIGSRGKSDPIGSFQKLATGSKGKNLGIACGSLAVLSTVCILSFYSVIAGWAMYFLVISLGGYAGGIDSISHQLEDLQTAAGGKFLNASLLCHTLFMILTVCIVNFGVQKGIEAACKVLMPTLMVLLLVLMIIGLNMEGGPTAVKFMFQPHWESLTGDALLEAVGHAFFTLSLGVGAMITYGSYLDTGGGRSIVKDVLAISIMDTLIAVVAGLAIFSVTFTYCLEPATGPTLLFATLPVQFAQMPGGTAFGIAFFSLVVFAALTSAVAFLEVVTTTVVDRLDGKITRKNATVLVGLSIWLLGFASVFSEDASEFLDDFTTRYCLPVGGFMTAIFAGYCMSTADSAAGMGGYDGTNPNDNNNLRESTKLYKTWHFLIRYVTPILVAITIMNKIGIFGKTDAQAVHPSYPKLEKCQNV